MRVLIAVTHLLGAGHLTRAAALARAFAKAGHEVTLISGGSAIPLSATDGISLVQLPPVKTRDTDFRTLLDEEGQPINKRGLADRRDLLLKTLHAARPDVVITELFPFGRRVLASEFDALIEEARQQSPRPLIVCSIRDILVAPTKPDRIAEAHTRLVRDYDAVLVHGDPALVPLEASWPVDDRTRPLLHYTGYVDENGTTLPEAERDGIIVSGGSSAASLPLYRTSIEAAWLVADRAWRILIGPGVEDADFLSLRALAPSHVSVERARSDFRALLSRAALSVSQAGYNTVVDILRAGVRPVFVPFEAGHETEQRLRAERLKEIGLAEIVPEDALSPEHLANAIRSSLARPAPDAPAVSLDGAKRSVAIVENLVLSTPALHRAVNWSTLTDALDGAKDEGCALGFWWRDDDAVAHTPELDRLLDLVGRYEAGLALAAIPHALTPSLALRLAGEDRVFALVHGSRHTNHAPPSEKKAEFGDHRPVDVMAHEAGEALRTARMSLGEKLLPVFVPPWNRISPSLGPLLSREGYRALSTFTDRKTLCPAPDLVQINTHVDPIDWHGSRSVLEPAQILTALSEAISRRFTGAADRNEPIGILTHHLVHDEAIWIFCERLLAYFAARNIHFLRIDELFRNPDRITVGP
ncbi:glycosyltransferase [Microvirga terricola]|uniref:Glycosyl transferase family 28 n=1 Tax=Microvirga terricola TaxID=2719797 RepID=A0ABX0VAG0_9HYPH|nr:glycosyltransferase [Microvirga terricola]NIX76838.1 glycosyl transferase family 28 [Microvirga terricola]